MRRPSCTGIACSSIPAPLTYLAERGFGKEVVEQAQLGYAAGGELVPYLAWRGLPAHAARRAGLLDSDGRERLAGRIVFPEVRDGEPIWLIGRLLDADSQDPRYLGLPGVKPLLGWEDADRDRRGTCLVEGPLDLLALRQSGRPRPRALRHRPVARHASAQLARWDHVYAVLDADAAGQEATARLVELLGARVIPVALPPRHQGSRRSGPTPRWVRVVPRRHPECGRGSSKARPGPFTRRLEGEEFRKWLILPRPCRSRRPSHRGGLHPRCGRACQPRAPFGRPGRQAHRPATA